MNRGGVSRVETEEIEFLEVDEELITFLIEKRVINPVTNCWLIKNETKLHEYRKLSLKGWCETAPRFSALAFLGEADPIPKGIEICHKTLCPFKACFNPDHLYIGNHGSNKRDYWKSIRISENHCMRGHEYNIRKSGIKYCSECAKRYRKNRFNPH